MKSKGNKKYRKVLLTCAGGGVIPAIIKSLKTKPYTIIAADMDPNAIGFYFADKSFVIPGGASREFFDVILDICKREKIDAIVPLADEELLKCTDLEKYNIAVILPRREFIKICLDKYLLMRRLEKFNFPVPKTKLASDGYNGLSFPLVIKPRKGRGSRGLKIVKSRQELINYLKNLNCNLKNLLLQEHIDGLEYTTSVVVWRDGKVQAVVPKEIVCKRGITRIAITRRNSKIEELCKKVQCKLRADGPFNVQLRLDPVSNEPVIFEINPRFSTTISLTMAAGVDELDALLNQAFGSKRRPEFGKWQEGIVLLRQTLDQFIDEKDFLDRSLKITSKSENIAEYGRCIR